MSVLATVIGAASAGAFLILGALMLASKSPPGSVIAVGALTAAFGLVASVVLLLAWFRPRPHLFTITLSAAAVLVIVWTGASFDGGSIVGLEGAGLAILAAVSFGLALSVRMVARGRLTRGSSGPPAVVP